MYTIMTSQGQHGESLQVETYQMGILPPRDELWVVIQEAHNYLKEWVTIPSARVHPTVGTIQFNPITWGEAVVVQSGEPTCEVCLAGLWYLQKGYGLLGGRGMVPPLPDFLDNLRSPVYHADNIYEYLGVVVPEELEDQLVGTNMWESYNPNHILLFLGWLLDMQYTSIRQWKQ